MGLQGDVPFWHFLHATEVNDGSFLLNNMTAPNSKKRLSLTAYLQYADT
jgi:hypothetical protein